MMKNVAIASEARLTALFELEFEAHLLLNAYKVKTSVTNGWGATNGDRHFPDQITRGLSSGGLLIRGTAFLQIFFVLGKKMPDN